MKANFNFRHFSDHLFHLAWLLRNEKYVVAICPLKINVSRLLFVPSCSCKKENKYEIQKLAKTENLPYSTVHTYVINEYLTTCSSCQKKFLEGNCKNNICCPFKNASFGNFCVRIDKLFEPHWTFEYSVKSDITVFESSLQRLCATREIDKFGR